MSSSGGAAAGAASLGTSVATSMDRIDDAAAAPGRGRRHRHAHSHHGRHGRRGSSSPSSSDDERDAGGRGSYDGEYSDYYSDDDDGGYGDRRRDYSSEDDDGHSFYVDSDRRRRRPPLSSSSRNRRGGCSAPSSSSHAQAAAGSAAAANGRPRAARQRTMRRSLARVLWWNRRMESVLQRWFGYWGEFVAVWPKMIILCTCILTIVTSLGLIVRPVTYQYLSGDSTDIWLSDVEPYTGNRDYVIEQFGEAHEERVILVPKGGENIFSTRESSKEYLRDALTLIQGLYAIEVTYENSVFSLRSDPNSLCVEPRSGVCKMFSLLDLWDYNQLVLDADFSPLETVRKEFQTAETVFGFPLTVDSVLGGIVLNEDGEISEAYALSMWFYLKGRSFMIDDPDSSIWTGIVQDWEGKFIDYITNFKSDYLDVYGMKSTPLQNVFLQGVLIDVVLLYCSLALMVLLLFVSLASFDCVVSKVLLAFAGATHMLLAGAASSGSCAFLNIPNTPVSETLFFMVMVSGMNHMLIIIHSFERAVGTDGKGLVLVDEAKWFRETLAASFPSILLETTCEIVAFLALSVSDIPGLRAVCQQAAVTVFFEVVMLLTFFSACLVLDSRRVIHYRSDILPCIKCVPDVAMYDDEVVYADGDRNGDAGLQDVVQPSVLADNGDVVTVIDGDGDGDGRRRRSRDSSRRSADGSMNNSSARVEEPAPPAGAVAEDDIEGAVVYDTGPLNSGLDDTVIEMTQRRKNALIRRRGQFLVPIADRFYGPVLLQPPVQVITFTLVCALFALAIYGISNWHQVLNITDFYKPGTYQYDFLTAKDEYFSRGDIPIDIVVRSVDYSDPLVGARLLAFDDAVSASPYIQQRSYRLWYRDFIEYVAVNTTYPLINHTYPDPEIFDLALRDFWDSKTGEVYQADLALGLGLTLEASRFQPLLISLGTLDDQTAAVEALYQIADYSGLDSFPFGQDFNFYMAFPAMEGATQMYLVISGMAVILVTFLLTDVVSSLTITLCFSFVNLELIGVVMYYSDPTIPMSQLSVATVVITTALSLTFTVHIAHEFLVTTGTYRQRVLHSIRTMGYSITNTLICCLIGSSLLLFAQSVIFQTFIKMYLAALILSWGHGLIVLPIFLSWLGVPNPEKGH